jgi:integrase
METAWQDCLRDFLRTMAMRSQDTSTSYGGTLRRFFAQHEPAKVTRREVEAFAHAHHALGPPSIATINLRLAAIASFYKYASFYIPAGETEPLWKLANPTLGIPRGKPERTYHVLTHEQFAKFLSVIPDTLLGKRDKAACLLFFWTARRRSELLPLFWGQIGHTIILENDGTRREGFTYTFRNKGEKSHEDVAELPTYAMLAIQRYLEADRRWGKMQPDSPVFLALGRPDGSGNVRKDEIRAFTAAAFSKRVAIYAKQAGLRVSSHTFRHMAARERYRAGSDIREIQQLLRHKSLATTDLYLRMLVPISDPGSKLLEKDFGYFS